MRDGGRLTLMLGMCSLWGKPRKPHAPMRAVDETLTACTAEPR
jgi:hypothetical protein